MIEEQKEDGEDLAKQPEIVKGIDVDCIHSLRWARLADTTERSLYWLIPAMVLAYVVFKIVQQMS
ncbi:MAG: hypothetical protein JOZ08_10175 [Verrucomicrobia bacterium]|nr:hypothetical protein [Verrucomicrobiota bacterium]